MYNRRTESDPPNPDPNPNPNRCPTRYNQADSLKQQLKGLGVSVRDRAQTWSYRAPPPRDFGPKGHDYARAQEDEARSAPSLHSPCALPALSLHSPCALCWCT